MADTPDGHELVASFFTLTGAGFGGACVALCQAGSASLVAAAVLERYRAGGMNGSLLVPAVDQPFPGAAVEPTRGA